MLIVVRPDKTGHGTIMSQRYEELDPFGPGYDSVDDAGKARVLKFLRDLYVWSDVSGARGGGASSSAATLRSSSASTRRPASRRTR